MEFQLRDFSMKAEKVMEIPSKNEAEYRRVRSRLEYVPSAHIQRNYSLLRQWLWAYYGLRFASDLPERLSVKRDIWKSEDFLVKVLVNRIETSAGFYILLNPSSRVLVTETVLKPSIRKCHVRWENGNWNDRWTSEWHRRKFHICWWINERNETWKSSAFARALSPSLPFSTKLIKSNPFNEHGRQKDGKNRFTAINYQIRFWILSRIIT